MSNLYKISILEKTNQMFVCSICCDIKVGSNSKPFATSNPSLFLEHQRYCHPSINEFECIYCCSHLPSVNLMQHIQNHFVESTDSRFTCPHCSERVRINMSSCLEHLETDHAELPLDCPHCRNQFPSRSDLHNHFKKHFLYVFHCSFDDCFVKSHSMPGVLAHLKRMHNGSRCLKVECVFTCTERISSKTQCNCSNNIQLSPHSPPKINSPTGDDCQLITLPYSARVLSKLSSGFDERLREDLISKMAQYSKFKVRLEVVDGQKQFVCSTCQYRSVHSLADVRKHILGCHCSVSTSYTRLCLRASRLDTNTFSLFSDRKLISFANEKLKRAESGTGWDANGDTSAMQLLDDSEPEQESPIDTISRPMKRALMSGGSIGSIKRAKMTQRQSHSAKMRPDSPVPEVGQPLVRNEKIDRVIHLNYSWHVLERLVAGQCPERYLPILRQKMDVYALHSILLTRRNGKRYFLCSHCPNCSPHGMNDIRKHILGVHARLPERFKAAAMYCSRMNRDNYGLLSDDELLKKNQDMVRWRKTPSNQNSDNEPTMDPLPPLQQPTGNYDDSSPVSQSQIYKSHNIFLSGDNGESSPLSVGDGEPTIPQFPYNIFGGFVSHSNAPASNESSPKLDDSSSVTSVITNSNNNNNGFSNNNNSQHGNGRSRRSIALKSRIGGATVLLPNTNNGNSGSSTNNNLGQMSTCSNNGISSYVSNGTI